MQRVLGQKGFSVLYSSVSLGALIWLILAASRAPYVQLWPWAPWQNLVTLAAMLAACLILCASFLRPNPFSFGGGRKPFDPDQPGLVRWMRHPLLLALALWGASHIVPNGNLAHVMLFGLFGGFALIGQRAVDRRKQRLLGARWHSVLKDSRSSSTPAFGRRELALRITAGFALFWLLIVLHPHVFGVHPWP